MIVRSRTAELSAGHNSLAEQGQSEAKKSRFSLNFLRASLLSPKAGSESIFRRGESPPADQQTRLALSPSSSPVKTVSDTANMAAQSYSPLGQGASAFTPPSAGTSTVAQQPANLRLSSSEIETALEDITVSRHSEESAPRSPLQALSSNSPTRRSQSLLSNDSSFSKALPVYSDAPGVPAHSSTVCKPLVDKQPADLQLSHFAKSQRSAQHSPLPANALVAYSSDEDDNHYCVDATQSKAMQDSAISSALP